MYSCSSQPRHFKTAYSVSKSEKNSSGCLLVNILEFWLNTCMSPFIMPGRRLKISVVLTVHLTLKYFFHSNKSSHLFETHCTFSPRFNPNLDFLQAVKVTKSGHHLLHDRASKWYGSIPGLMSQTSLHACLQRL